MKYDVVIIGAGPAGLFACFELLRNEKASVLVVDQGYDVENRICPVSSYKGCTSCTPCHIMCGVGGAGTLSSGLLNLRPDIGGNLVHLLDDDETAWELVRYVDQIFLDHGAPDHLYEADENKTEELERKAAEVGVKFIPIPQRHIGTDNAPRVIKRLKDTLDSFGTNFLLGNKVIKFDPGVITLEDGQEIFGEYIIVAPGRVGADWLARQADRLKIPSKYEPVDLGVRVEVPAVVMEPIVEISRDPKFHIYSDTYDDFVRTFCVNHRGFVVQEAYDEFVGINGHAMANSRSSYSNFALLVRIGLTQPLEDTSAYAKTVAIQATTLGGGKPIVQRLSDLQKGRRSTWSRIERGNVQPTLPNVTPGDISMALPHRIVTDIIEGLKKLNHVIPGVFSSSTLLYAPEVKLSANRIYTNRDLETSRRNLFVAGDGAGLSRGIVVAAATGVIAARGILKKM